MPQGQAFADKVLKMTRRLLHCEDSFPMLGTAGKVENYLEGHVIARHRSGPSGDICDSEYRHRGSYLLPLNLSHQRFSLPSLKSKMGELTKTLPGSWYCSKQLHDLERRAVFLKVDFSARDCPHKD